MSRAASFITGALLPFEALRLIAARRTLMMWSALPILITIVLYGFLITWLQDSARGLLVQYFNSWGWDPAGWLASGVLLLTRILMLVVGAFTFSFVAGIAASPFNDFLAEATEKWVHPPLSVPPETNLGGKLKLIWIDLVKTVAATAGMIFALIFSWIPVLNIVAFVAAFALVTFQYISYPQTRRGQGVREGLRFLWRHLYACAGFGAVTTLFFSVPVVSSFYLPVAVVGGTLLFARAPGARPELPPLK